MVFLWFSHGFPMVFPWFSYGFPMVFPWLSLVPSKPSHPIPGVRSAPVSLGRSEPARSTRFRRPVRLCRPWLPEWRSTTWKTARPAQRENMAETWHKNGIKIGKNGKMGKKLEKMGKWDKRGMKMNQKWFQWLMEQLAGSWNIQGCSKHWVEPWIELNMGTAHTKKRGGVVSTVMYPQLGGLTFDLNITFQFVCLHWLYKLYNIIWYILSYFGMLSHT